MSQSQSDAPKPMMVLRTAQASILVRILDVLKELICDCNIIFSPGGLVVSVMDAGQQVYAYVNLPGSLFEEYHCEGVHALGVNNNYFHKLIKQATNRDELTLSYHPTAPEMTIMIANLAKGVRSVSKMKLLDIENELLEMPLDRSYATMAEMNAADFLKICRELVSIGEEITVLTDPVEQSITFRADGDIGQVQQTLMNSEKQSVKNKDVKAIEETFALRPLAMMAKTATISQFVTLYLDEAFPMLLKYSVADKGVVAFCLAPRLNKHRPVVDNAL